MNRRLWLAAAVAVAAPLTLQGCASAQLADYEGETPALDLREYFNGTLDAWGIFQNRSGKVVRRFSVVMVCQWQGDLGTLDERFAYSDGSSEQRIWHLQRHAGGHYTGTAADVSGTAKGQTRGNAFQWQYTLRLPVNGTTYEVQLDDWMYLIDQRVLLNRARMSKLGVHLGDLTLSFSKRAP